MQTLTEPWLGFPTVGPLTSLLENISAFICCQGIGGTAKPEMSGLLPAAQAVLRENAKYTPGMVTIFRLAVCSMTDTAIQS